MKWLLIFFSSSFILTGCLALFNVYINPYSTFDFDWKLPFKSDRNPNVAKLTRLINKKDTQCLIVGSSRSEFFLPTDLKNKMNCESFSASVPGAKSYEKYAFSKFALESLPKLKQIWYIIDFYEFNQKPISPKVRHIERLGKYFNSEMFKDINKSTPSKFTSLFSRSTLKASFRNLKDYLRGRQRNYYRDDGTTTRSLNISLSDSFEVRVDNSISQYKKGEWLNFQKLSLVSFEGIKEIKNISIDKGVKIHFIVSPLYSRVKNEIMKDSKLSILATKMNAKLSQLFPEPTSPNFRNSPARLWNFFNSLDRVVPGDDTHWYDGAHTTRLGSLKMIEYIKSRTQDDLDISKKQ